MVERYRKTKLQAPHTEAVNEAVMGHEMIVALDDRPLPISISEKDITKKERSTKIWILWTPGLIQEQNQEGCIDCCMTPHYVKHRSLRLASPPDHSGTVRLMEQTGGRCTGIYRQATQIAMISRSHLLVCSCCCE